MFLWAPANHTKARELTPTEKIVNERFEDVLTEKAVARANRCWEHEALGCTHTPIAHVHEVQFDLKEDKAKPLFRQVSTADYDGPVPGFCIGHLSSGPARLAEAVYFSRPEMQWGLKPRRWFVIFTDGSKTGGECLYLDPKQLQPEFKEEFTGDHIG